MENLLRPAKHWKTTPRAVRPAMAPRSKALPDAGTHKPASLSSDPWRSIPVPRMGDMQCWRCSSWGHSWAQCPIVRSLWNAGADRRASYVQRACATHLYLVAVQFEREVWVNHHRGKALLDCMVMLVHVRVIGRLGTVGKDSTGSMYSWRHQGVPSGFSDHCL